MSLKVVVFFGFVSMAAAGISVVPLQPLPETYKKFEGCYIEELDAVVLFGVMSQIVPSKKQCMQYRCGERNLEITTCGTTHFDISNNPNCKVYEDKEKSYPECCPTVKCELPTTTEIFIPYDQPEYG